MKCPFMLPAKVIITETHKKEPVRWGIETGAGWTIIFDIIHKDKADYIVNAVNCHEKLVELCLLNQKLSNYTQHSYDCALAPEDTNDNCDCGLDELVTKIIEAEEKP